jgi:hypothetical protein
LEHELLNFNHLLLISFPLARAIRSNAAHRFQLPGEFHLILA